MKFIVNCSDLYDNAAEKLKKIDNDIDKTIQVLAKEVEMRGVPRSLEMQTQTKVTMILEGNSRVKREPQEVEDSCK